MLVNDNHNYINIHVYLFFLTIKPLDIDKWWRKIGYKNCGEKGPLNSNGKKKKKMGDYPSSELLLFHVDINFIHHL